MNFAIAIAFLIVPVVTGVLIDGKSRERSLVLATHQKDVVAKLNDLDPQNYLTRSRRAAGALELIEFKVDVKIRYRYSKTYVTSHVRNSDSRAQEVTFQVILPETAFISKFVMEIDQTQYEAYVEEREAAKADYERAKSRGQSAGLLELNARHANVFNVSVSIKAGSIVWFNLTYEELLCRRFGRYEQAITLNGDEISKNNDVQVHATIEESQELKHVRAYNYQNELDTRTDSENSKKADINKDGKNRATIMWKPSSKTDILKRFVIQYDVKREADSGEVLIMNGYFVHFFSPPKLKSLQKHIVFILDVSGSMEGRKIEQMKEAIKEILKDLRAKDYINLVIFSDTVTVWTPGDVYTAHYGFGGRGIRNKTEHPRFQPFRANSKNIQDAKGYIDSLKANGGTNINDALVEALTLIARFKKARDDNETGSEKNKSVASPVEILEQRTESMILFLTDGEATSGETNLETIQKNIQLGNLGLSVPLFSLAFGTGADFTFLRKLSLQNHAFARKIYEAADASLQLQGFYAEISSPLLSNVQFNYTSPDSPYAVSEMTRTTFPSFYKGWELPVAGKIGPSGNNLFKGNSDEDMSDPKPSSKMAFTDLLPYPPTDSCHFYTDVSGIGYDGLHHWHRPMIYVPHRPWWCYPPPPPIPVTTTPKPPTDEDTFLERLWAYLTIQNLIENDLAGVTETGESPKQRILRLALKYGFVTSQTSLVVVKPDSKNVTTVESADARPTASPKGWAAGKSGVRPVAFNRGSSKLTIQKFASFESVNDMYQTDDDAGPPMFNRGRLEDTNDDINSRPPPQQTTTTNPKPPPTKSVYTLQDLKWLIADTLTIDDTDDGTSKNYRVAKSEQESSNSTGTGSECTIKSPGSRINRGKGKCEHLKDCIHDDFVDDFDVYQDSYFCPIQSTASSEMFAGACCETA